MAIKGLASIKRQQEENKAREAARNRPKAEWLTSVFPKKTGDSIVVRFMQEIDEDAPNYNAERGLGMGEVEHQAPGPDGFKRRATCTSEEGACYACERHAQDRTAGWRQRQNFYINVALKVDGEVKPFVLARNFNSTFVESLFQEAIDEGSITDAMYRITKTGEGTQTNWLLKRLPKEELLDDSGIEVFDIEETALRHIEYEKQAEWYGNAHTPTDDVPQQSGSSDSGVDAEW